MTNLKLLAAAGLVLVFSVHPGVAGPFANSADAIAKAASTNNDIVKVHECNRACLYGQVPKWGGIFRWHRHVGPACTPVRCKSL